MGPKSNKEGTLYSRHTVLRRFKVPLEAHETKEKERKEQVSDANETKSKQNDSVSYRLGVRKMVFVDSELCSTPKAGSNI